MPYKQEIADFLHKYSDLIVFCSNISIAVSSALISLPDSKDGYILYLFLKSASPIVFMVSIVFSLISSFWLWKNKENFFDLKQKNESLIGKVDFIGENIRALFEGYLIRFGKKIDFSIGKENTERVTLYIYDSEKNVLVPCGRYSANMTYMKAGRSEYPVGQGCIGYGWDHGWLFDKAFPVDVAGRIGRHNQEYKVPRGVATKFNMPSRLYAVLRIKDGNGKPIALLVVESTDANRWEEALLKAEMKSQEEYIGTMVSVLNGYIPKPSRAESKGL